MGCGGWTDLRERREGRELRELQKRELAGEDKKPESLAEVVRAGSVLTRRFGGGWEEWTEPKKWNFYHNMNIEAQLPALLADNQRPTLLTIYVADDLPGNRERVKRAELKVELKGVTAEDRIEEHLAASRRRLFLCDG